MNWSMIGCIGQRMDGLVNGWMDGYLDEVWCILSVQGVFGQLVSVHHPGMSEDLSRRQSPMRIYMQHLGHQILPDRTNRL